MNKEDFIRKLEQNLKHIPKEDREDAIQYYTEYFEEMDADENQDITGELGNPEDIAKEIIANCTEKHIEEQKEKGGIKNSATVIWMIILAIFASPVAIPLALAAIVVFIAFLVVLFALVFTVVCTGGALTVSGVLVFSAIFFAPGMAQKLVCLGLSLILAGLGVIILIASIKLGELCIRGIAALFKQIFFRKKVAE